MVLSRGELVLEEKNRQKAEFWQNIAEGQTRTGIVKRIVDYGAFMTWAVMKDFYMSLN